MTCCVLDINAHYRIFSAHPLWSKADCIDSVFEKSLHLSCSFVLIVWSDRTHQCFLRKKCCRLNRCCHTYANEKRRAGIQSVCCHNVHNELCNSFVSFTRHQNHSFSRKSTSAPCHVCIDLTFVWVWNDIPEYSRCSFSYVLSCVVFIKCLYTVVTERCFKCCFHNSVFQKSFQFVDKWEFCSTFYPEL